MPGALITGCIFFCLRVDRPVIGGGGAYRWVGRELISGDGGRLVTGILRYKKQKLSGMFAKCFLFISLLKCLWWVQCLIFRRLLSLSFTYKRDKRDYGKRELQLIKFSA